MLWLKAVDVDSSLKTLAHIFWMFQNCFACRAPTFVFDITQKNTKIRSKTKIFYDNADNNGYDDDDDIDAVS